MNRIMKRTLGIFTALALVTALALPTAAEAPGDAKPAEAKPKEKAKDIDITICLDVSGSMGGLIESAKTKLWDLVNDMAKIQPAPNLRVGLYSYGHSNYDAKAGYVRKESDLTNDLDMINKKLFGLTINGGEEYVARVCRDAIEQQKWSEEKGSLKIIFVCGNEPANQDPQVQLKDVSQKAIAKDIVINTIYCGNAGSSEAAGWKDFAKASEGRFASIDQNKGAVAIATPMDKELGELSTKLNETYVVYGKGGNEFKANQTVQDGNAKTQSEAVNASRAVSKANGCYRCDTWDLVDKCKNDPKFDVKKIPDDELNETMKKMKPEEREQYVQEMGKKRDGLQKQINEVNVKRTEFIKAEVKKDPNKGDRLFDEAVRGALRDQAASKGIKIPE